MARRLKRFTIYDMMEEKGIFDENPANSYSEKYTGPIKYPMMLYHPQGEQKITVPAEYIMTPFGPKAVGEQRELIYRVANDAAEEKALRAAGWHDHPAKAIGASGKAAPPVSADQVIQEMQEKIARLQADLNNAMADKVSAVRGGDIIERVQLAQPEIEE